MRILLSLLSKDLGGMEFSFLDYLKVLKRNGHEVIVLTHELAPYLQGVFEYTDAVYLVNPRGYYDIRVWLKVKLILDKTHPDMVIAHGNKAVHLLRKASINRYPIIAINHSNNLKRSIGSNFLVTVNRGMKESAIDLGQHPEKCVVIPNMIDIKSHSFSRKPYQSPPVIGAMGRFTVEKGFRTFIHSLSIMNNQGIDFRAIVPGDGPLKQKLHDLTKLYSIDHKVSFPGWVHNKEAFYRSIDIMCVPSRYETFGMVILEAAMYSIPIVSTPTDGATSILTNEVHGLLTSNISPSSISSSLVKAINYEDNMAVCAKNCFDHIKAHYSLDIVGEQIEEVIKKVA